MLDIGMKGKTSLNSSALSLALKEDPQAVPDENILFVKPEQHKHNIPKHYVPLLFIVHYKRFFLVDCLRLIANIMWRCLYKICLYVIRNS